MKRLKYVVLSGAPNSRSTRRFVERAEKRGHKVRVIHPDDCYLILSEKKGDIRICIKSTEEELFAKDIDRVIVRIGGFPYGRQVLNHLSIMDIFCSSKVSGIAICGDKFLTAQVLFNNGIAIITQILTRNVNEQNAGYLIKLIGGIPFVYKVLTSSKGVGVGLADSELSAGTIIESISHFAKSLLLQRFVKTEDSNQRSSDIRVFIVDGEVVVAMKRYSKARQFRANFSISSMGEKVSLTKEQIELSLDAAAACKSLGVCGVDLLVDGEGKNLVVEVNSNPGLKIEEVTGVNVVDKIIDFTERGELSVKAIERYQKFDISAQVAGYGYQATGKSNETKRGNGKKGVLYEVVSIKDGSKLFYDSVFNSFFECQDGRYLRKF